MRLAIVTVAALFAATAAQGQIYPDKPIHVIVPFTAGSATDVVARAVAQAMSTRLGQPVVVDNKPGAGGTIEEAGYTGSAYDFWVGMFAPAGTPPALIERLNKEVVAALASPEVKKRLGALGADASPTTPAELDNTVARELKENADLVQKVGIKIQ